MECWQEEVMSVSVSEKKQISEKSKEPGKVKVKNLVGRNIMEVILKTKDPTGDGCQVTPRYLVLWQSAWIMVSSDVVGTN